jgi:RND family efflux transporter MFP subunit
MRVKNVLVVSALAGAALLSWSCASTVEAKPDTRKALTIAPVTRVARANLERTIELPAYFKPYLEVDLHAKVAGYLKWIKVDIGDRVERGELLATIEIPELHDEIVEAAAEVRRDQAEVTRAEHDLARARSSYAAAHIDYVRLLQVSKVQPNLIAQQELDDAQAKDLGGAARVSASQAALDAARRQVQVALAEQDKLNTMYSYTRITAPFDGVVTKRYADPGAMIQDAISSASQSLPLLHVAMDRVLRMMVPVPEAVVPTIHIGEPVAVRVPALNRTFQGKVTRFTDSITNSTRTMDTEIDVQNPDHTLTPGMYAYATFTTDSRNNVLAVPIEAVSGLDTGSPSVMVVGPADRIERRPIRTGLQTSSQVEVLTGLKRDEMVVAANPAQFSSGEVVQPRTVEVAALKEGND